MTGEKKRGVEEKEEEKRVNDKKKEGKKVYLKLVKECWYKDKVII